MINHCNYLYYSTPEQLNFQVAKKPLSSVKKSTVCALLINLFTTPVFAETIPFKQMLTANPKSLSYFLAFAALTALIMIFAKKNPSNLSKQSSCIIIDKKRLGAKTSVYIVEYHNQPFLIADNQHTLVLQTLTAMPTSKRE